jgi:hypothetical protein
VYNGQSPMASPPQRFSASRRGNPPWKGWATPRSAQGSGATHAPPSLKAGEGRSVGPRRNPYRRPLLGGCLCARRPRCLMRSNALTEGPSSAVDPLGHGDPQFVSRTCPPVRHTRPDRSRWLLWALSGSWHATTPLKVWRRPDSSNAHARGSAPPSERGVGVRQDHSLPKLMTA